MAIRHGTLTADTVTAVEIPAPPSGRITIINRYTAAPDTDDTGIYVSVTDDEVGPGDDDADVAVPGGPATIAVPIARPGTPSTVTLHLVSEVAAPFTVRSQ